MYTVLWICCMCTCSVRLSVIQFWFLIYSHTLANTHNTHTHSLTHTYGHTVTKFVCATRFTHHEIRFTLTYHTSRITLHTTHTSHITHHTSHITHHISYKRVCSEHMVPVRYVDDYNNKTEVYPLNPNGSPDGIAALCSADGRHLAIMPHPGVWCVMYDPWFVMYDVWCMRDDVSCIIYLVGMMCDVCYVMWMQLLY